MAKKTTILDVAKAADVSIATVSRVLNNPQSVRASTRLRVQKAFSDTGYSLDATPAEPEEEPKKERKTEKSNHMLLVIVPDVKNPFYSDVLDGISTEAGYFGYDTILYQVHELRYTYEQLKNLVDALDVCGVLLLGKVARTRDLEQLGEYIPVVQCAEYVKSCSLPYVSIDDYAAAKTAMKLLIRNGRKKIALINGPIQYKYAEDRESAYRDTLQEAGLEVEESFIIHQSASEFDLAVSNVTQMLQKEGRPDAVFAVSDTLAVATVRAAKALGLRVPEDVSVIGFDGTYISNLCDPPLTVVRQPGQQLGTYACEMLVNIIRGTEVSNQHILLNVDLLVREST